MVTPYQNIVSGNTHPTTSILALFLGLDFIELHNNKKYANHYQNNKITYQNTLSDVP